MSNRILVMMALAGVCTALSFASADEGKLRLNFDAAPSLSLDAPSGQITLDELLSVSPRSDGLSMSLSTPESGLRDRLQLGLEYGDEAYGVRYEVFTSVVGGGSGNFDLSGLRTNQPARAVTSDSDLSLDPDPENRRGVWQIGGKVGYAGFDAGAEFARNASETDAIEYRDFRLGVSYGGENWRVGMRYMRAVQSDAQNLSDNTDAVELGGVWTLNPSVNLIGGMQLRDRPEIAAQDGQTRKAMIFVGARFRF